MLQLVQSQARRGVMVALVAGLAAVLAVAAAPPVTAAITPGLDDAIVKVPSSVIGSLDGVSPRQRALAMAKTGSGGLNDWRIPMSGVSKATKASAPFTLTAAYLAAVEGTGFVMKVGGVNPNNVGPESLWDYIGPRDAVDPGYTSNGDMANYAEGNGWRGYRVPKLNDPFTGTYNGEPINGTRIATWNAQYNPSTRVFTYGATVTGQPPIGSTFSNGWEGNYWAASYYKRNSTGVVERLASSSGRFPNPSSLSDTMLAERTLLTYEVAFLAKGDTNMSGTPAQKPDSYVWYPPGHPDRPAEADGNPPRNWLSSWSCSGGAGGSAKSDVFFESDTSWPEYPAASCATGQLQTLDVYQQTSDGAFPDVLVHRWVRGANDPFDWATNNPECLSGACSLILSRIDEQTSARISCFNSPALCTNWLVDPARADKYECTYGGKVVALVECQVYGPTFNVATGVNIKDETGDETDVRTVGILGDPKTGKPVPTTTTPTVPDPGTETPPRDNSCPPPFTWTSLINPWWYYKGMTCALADAFIPTQTQVQTHVGKVQTVWAGTAPAKWAAAVGGTFDGVAVQESGCLGPRIYWSYIDLELYPFNACNAPMSTWASWTKTFASAVIVFSGGFACFRAIGSGIGWKPSAGGDS